MNARARKQRVLLLFGGRSAEHDVSRVTAVAVARALDPARYDVVPVAITVEGELGCLGSLETMKGDKEDGHGAEGHMTREMLLTDPDQAADYLRRVRSLAVNNQDSLKRIVPILTAMRLAIRQALSQASIAGRRQRDILPLQPAR